ncbi:MAG: ESS family glutamate:Na+ symporter [Myxococcota bacterium]|jgi:ESS family glutamate:Na+ symporter
MDFWKSGVVEDGLWLCLLLVLATAIARAVPAIRRLALPPPLLAGLIGLAVGPSALGLLPFNPETFEAVVYHGLAIIFIAVSLQPSRPRAGRPAIGHGARSMAFAIPFMAVTQGLIGMTIVLVLHLLSIQTLHPGFGLMLPLAFGQGPGQALSLGAAWEQTGMESGGQIGLIMAAIGFIWCALSGVPLAAYGRSRGWAALPPPPAATPAPTEAAVAGGGLDSAALNVGAVGIVYLLTYAALTGLVGLVADKPQIAAMVWGFHFIVAMAIGLSTRALLGRVAPGGLLSREELGRVATVTVAFSTAAAIAAVQLSVLKGVWLPILLITSIGGVSTLLAALWLSRRVFPDEPFEHGLVMFGAATGTLHTGLALLQTLDPELRGSAPNSAVVGSAGAFVLAAPLLLFVVPFTVAGWPDAFVGTSTTAVVILVVYLVLLLVGWRLLGALRPLRPLSRMWPEQPHPLKESPAAQ